MLLLVRLKGGTFPSFLVEAKPRRAPPHRAFLARVFSCRTAQPPEPHFAFRRRRFRLLLARAMSPSASGPPRGRRRCWLRRTIAAGHPTASARLPRDAGSRTSATRPAAAPTSIKDAGFALFDGGPTVVTAPFVLDESCLRAVRRGHERAAHAGAGRSVLSRALRRRPRLRLHRRPGAHGRRGRRSSTPPTSTAITASSPPPKRSSRSVASRTSPTFRSCASPTW